MYKIATSLLVFVLISFKGLDSCISSDKSPKIKAIKVSYYLPVVTQDGNIVDMGETYEVFYQNNFVMYKLRYGFDSSVNHVSVLSEQRDRYFVYHKDSLFGQFYYPHPNHPHPYGRTSVDSMLKYTQKSMFDSLVTVRPDSAYTDAEGNFIKVYIQAAGKENPESFITYFYYTKNLAKIKETFSKMDNIKSRKLSKIRMMVSGGYYELYKMTFPKREMILEMKEMKVENEQEISGYFNRYIKEQRKA